MACFSADEDMVIFIAPNSLRHSSIIAAASDRYAGTLARRGLSLGPNNGSPPPPQQHRYPAGMRSGAGSSVSNLNERDASAQPLTIKTRMRFRDFLKLAGQALAVSGPRRVFLANGREIWTVRDLNQGSTAYISSGEPFFRQNSIDISSEVDSFRGGGVGRVSPRHHLLSLEEQILLQQQQQDQAERSSLLFDELDDYGGASNEARLFISVLGPQGSGKSSIVQRLLKGGSVSSPSSASFGGGGIGIGGGIGGIGGDDSGSGSELEPTIEDTYRKSLFVDNICDNVEVLDTGGSDAFRSLRQQWMADKDAYVLVFSLADRKGFEELDTFAQLHFAINGTRRLTPPLVLVGNKCDAVEDDKDVRDSGDGGPIPSFGGMASYKTLPRQVTRAEALRKLDEWRALFTGTDIAAADVGSMTYLECSAATGRNVDEAFHCAVRQIRLQRRRHNDASRRKRDNAKSALGSVSLAGIFRCCTFDDDVDW